MSDLTIEPVIDSSEQNKPKAVLKNFRSDGPIEIFYRFVHDNGLRREARMAIEHIYSELPDGRKGKKRGKSKDIQ